jgi:hypothetical protein
MNDDFVKNDQEKNTNYDTRDAEVPVVIHPSNPVLDTTKSNGEHNRRQRYIQNTLRWLWSGFRYIWRQIIGNRSFWEFTATIAVAIATSLYTYYARKQWKVANDTLIEIRNSKADTQQNARAARDSADTLLASVVRHAD